MKTTKKMLEDRIAEQDALIEAQAERIKRLQESLDAANRRIKNLTVLLKETL